MADFKKLSDVEVVETPMDSAKVLIEENGVIKRVPKDEVGGIKVAAAEVGQTIVVKAVDEAGNPTEWEAVDLPKNGGGYDIVIDRGEDWNGCNLVVGNYETLKNKTLSRTPIFGVLIGGHTNNATYLFVNGAQISGTGVDEVLGLYVMNANDIMVMIEQDNSVWINDIG